MTEFSVWMSGLAALPVLKLGLVIHYPVLQNQRAALVEFAPRPHHLCFYRYLWSLIVKVGNKSQRSCVNIVNIFLITKRIEICCTLADMNHHLYAGGGGS